MNHGDDTRHYFYDEVFEQKKSERYVCTRKDLDFSFLKKLMVSEKFYNNKYLQFFNSTHLKFFTKKRKNSDI